MSNQIDFSLYLITDRKQVHQNHNLFSMVEAALKGGVKAIQLREKDLSIEQLLPLAQQLRQLTLRYQAKLLINTQIDIALAVDADGVHLGGDAPPIERARQRLGPNKLIGVSTHHQDEILQAAQDGADFVSFSPIYFTPSKAEYGAPQGVQALKEICAKAPIPVFALGGISVERQAEVLKAGAHGVALISAICAATDSEQAARAFLA
ncbi:MAG: thiamine phosphate synthase [Desulfuromonadales bacterium]|nr:thiamine phosphate synthase [Desulfuromonadales bacterium]